MRDDIFRKKSLDKVKSPESLDDYIRVSNPGVWLLLLSVIVLLIGVCVWGVFGHIESTVPASVRVENGEAVCYITEEQITSIRAGQKVKLNHREAVIESIGEKVDAGYPCILSDIPDLCDGYYEAKIITDSYKPLSFVLN